jgi:hypothetical protein
VTATEAPPEALTRYRVTWTLKGEDKPRTREYVMNLSRMRRPSDRKELEEMLQIRISLRDLPPGGPSYDDVVLLDVMPLCNCEPQPTKENCAFRDHGGYRFYLTTSVAYAGFEVIRDRHDDTILGTVHAAHSVEFLTSMRNKYDHQ